MTVEELVATLGLEVNKEGFEKAEKALTGLQGIALAVGAAVVAVGAAIAEMIHETSEAADHVDKMSQSLGVSTTALQELNHAAALSGLSTEELGVGLQQLSRMALEAKDGSAQTAEAFRRAGVRLTDTSGNLRPVEEMLGDIAERFHSMPDGTEKTALAMQLMGRSGARMIPLLNGGRQSLEAMRKEAHQLGLVLDEETIRAGTELDENTKRLREGLTGLRYEIGGPLLRGASDFIAVLVEWTKRFNEIARSPLKTFLEDLWAVLEGAARIIWQPIRVISEGFFQLVDSTIGWKTALEILGGIAAIALFPIYGTVLLVGAAFAALLLLFDDFITYLEGGDSVIGDLTDTVQALWPVVLALLRAKWDEFVTWIEAKTRGIAASLTNFFGDAFETAVDFWRQLFTGFWDWLVAKVKGLGQNVLDAVKGAAEAAAQAVPGGDFLVNHLFGPGASSPAGSAQNAPAGAPGGGNSFHVEQHISSTHGQSALEIGQASADSLEDFHNRKMAEAAAAVG